MKIRTEYSVRIFYLFLRLAEVAALHYLVRSFAISVKASFFSSDKALKYSNNSVSLLVKFPSSISE